MTGENSGAGKPQDGGPKDRANLNEDLTQSDFGADIQGRNNLQGTDQASFRNERQTMPEETDETEGVVESFEKMDPKARAGNSPL